MDERRLTKRPMRITTVRIPTQDSDLLFLAAQRQGISQSEFFRIAIREKAARILAEEPLR